MTKYELLEKLRKDLGYSRKKIGEILEVSPSTIEKYEKGRLDFNYKTKYILGICALAGYNNELFEEFEEYENFTDEEIFGILGEYKLSKYSSKIRQILYFLNTEYDEYIFFLRNLLVKKLKLSIFSHKSFLNEINNYILNNEKQIFDINEYSNYLDEELKSLPENEKNILKSEMIKDKEELDNYKYALQIIFLYVLNFFNPKDFYDKTEFINNIKKILDDVSFFIKIFHSLDDEETPISYIVESDFQNDIHKLKKLLPIIKKNIEDLEKNGKPVNKETIKEFKIELESGTLFANSNTPTDPKDKQICELLQYAPPAFKDKIIEKLLQYKKDVEEF